LSNFKRADLIIIGLNLLFLAIESLLRNIPGGLGRRLRYSYYKRRLGSCGRRVVIGMNVMIHSPRHVFIGDEVWIDQGVLILAGKISGDRKSFIKKNKQYAFQPGELHIGNRVHIGPQVILQAHGGMAIGSALTVGAGSKLYSLSHHYKNLENPEDDTEFFFGSMVPERNQFLVQGAIVIEDGAAVGLNCILLPGAYVPKGTWLGVGMILRDQVLECDSVYSYEQVLHNKRKK
jgi:acetyltransferase-like isoleucine patch superfamily enzyme